MLKQSSGSDKLYGVVFLAIVLLACGVVACLELAGVTHIFHKSTSFTPALHSGGGAVNNQKGASSSSASGGSSSQPQGGNTKSTSGTSATATLITPGGDFVSNHHPHLSNNPAGSAYLVSTCTTTPGATCTITFTKDGISKSLPAETTDAGGTAYWDNWKLQDYGLTAGTWTIQATATLDGQIKSANDALNLEVAQ